MAGVLELYERARRVPLVGRGLFSAAFGFKAPYFLSIVPTMVELRPNFAQVRIRKWWGVHNHIGTVHVIAIANGLEMAMGALAEATIPTHLRWIPKGMQLDYTGLASSSVLATAETDPADWEAPGEVAVRVVATRADGAEVVRGVIRLHVTPRPAFSGRTSSRSTSQSSS